MKHLRLKRYGVNTTLMRLESTQVRSQYPLKFISVNYTKGITYIRTKGIKYSIWEEKCTKRVRNITVAAMREIAWGVWVV